MMYLLACEVVRLMNNYNVGDRIEKRYKQSAKMNAETQSVHLIEDLIHGCAIIALGRANLLDILV